MEKTISYQEYLSMAMKDYAFKHGWSPDELSMLCKAGALNADDIMGKYLEEQAIDLSRKHHLKKLSELSLTECLIGHRRLWDWMTLNPLADKKDCPDWKDYDPVEARKMDYCFCCAYSEGNCKFCPLDWPDHHCGGLLARWMHFKGPGRIQEASDAASIISNMPLKSFYLGEILQQSQQNKEQLGRMTETTTKLVKSLEEKTEEKAQYHEALRLIHSYIHPHSNPRYNSMIDDIIDSALTPKKSKPSILDILSKHRRWIIWIPNTGQKITTREGNRIEG